MTDEAGVERGLEEELISARVIRRRPGRIVSDSSSQSLVNAMQKCSQHQPDSFVSAAYADRRSIHVLGHVLLGVKLFHMRNPG